MTERTTPTAKVSAEDVLLRPVEPSDIPLFFTHASDREALRVAAFAPAPPADLKAYRARWSRLLSSADTLVRTVVHDGNVVGHLISFPRLGRREVGGWFARASWGRGIATSALRSFLVLDRTRPLHARAAADNLGALRVLGRCGFRLQAIAGLLGAVRRAEGPALCWRLERCSVRSDDSATERLCGDWARLPTASEASGGRP